MLFTNEISLNEIEKLFNKMNELIFNSCLIKPIFSFKKSWNHNELIKKTDKEICNTKSIKHSNKIDYSIILSNIISYFSLIDVIQHLSHQMLHLYCLQYNIQATSRQGYYHNINFKKIAESFDFIVTKDKNGYGKTKVKKNMVDKICNWYFEEKEKNNIFNNINIEYYCPICNTKILAIPKQKIICGKCNVEFIETTKQKKGENEMQKDNWIVTYYKNKAIVMNEDRLLFYIEIPKEFVVLGETVAEEDLTPVSTLSGIEKAEINIAVYDALEKYDFFD